MLNTEQSVPSLLTQATSTNTWFYDSKELSLMVSLKNIWMTEIFIIKTYCDSWESANNRIKRAVIGGDLYVKFTQLLPI